MKRHHLTLLSAIAIVLVGVWVALRTMQAPEADEYSAEAMEALKQRQLARYRESREARTSRPSQPALQLSPFKEQLLKEFPKLRPKPPIPDEQNPIYLLNALANELLDDGTSFREEIHQVMGSKTRWNSGEMKELIERYAHVLDKLDDIAEMPMGSFNFVGEDITSHPDAMMLLLDLMSLRSSEITRSGASEGLGDSLLKRARIARLIKYSEGATVMHGLMAEANNGTTASMGLKLEIYEHTASLGAYGAGMHGMFLPDWGAALSRQTREGDPDLLIDQIRGLWDNQLDQDRIDHNPVWGEMPVAKVYSAELNKIISFLQENDLDAYWMSQWPEISSDGLTPEQHQLVSQQIKETHETIHNILQHAAYQNFEAAARALRRSRYSGSHLHINMKMLPLNPITGEPYYYTAPTRLLICTTLHDGKVLALKIHPPGEGDFLNLGTFIEFPESE